MAWLRYVELNPVRAGIVDRPDDYHWSSYAQRMGLTDEIWLESDPVTETMGNTAAERRRAYAKFVSQGISPAELNFLRDAVRRNQLTGDSRFIDEIERRTGVRIESRGCGRPKNKSGTN